MDLLKAPFFRALALLVFGSLIPAGIYLAADQDWIRGFTLALAGGLIGLVVTVIVNALKPHRPLTWWIENHRTYEVGNEDIYAYTPWYPELVIGLLAGIVGSVVALLSPELSEKFLAYGILFGLLMAGGATLIWVATAALIRDDGLYIGTAAGIAGSLLLFPWDNSSQILESRSLLVWDRLMVGLVVVIVFFILVRLAIRFVRGGKKNPDMIMELDALHARARARARNK